MGLLDRPHTAVEGHRGFTKDDIFISTEVPVFSCVFFLVVFHYPPVMVTDGALALKKGDGI